MFIPCLIDSKVKNGIYKKIKFYQSILQHRRKLYTVCISVYAAENFVF